MDVTVGDYGKNLWDSLEFHPSEIVEHDMIGSVFSQAIMSRAVNGEAKGEIEFTGKMLWSASSGIRHLVIYAPKVEIKALSEAPAQETGEAL